MSGTNSRDRLRARHVATGAVAVGVAAAFAVAVHKVLQPIPPPPPKTQSQPRTKTKKGTHSSTSSSKSAATSRLPRKSTSSKANRTQPLKAHRPTHTFNVFYFDIEHGNPVERSYKACIRLKPTSDSSSADGANTGMDNSDKVDYPLLTVPVDNYKVYLVDDAVSAELLLQPILQMLENNPKKHAIMGLDTEWTNGDQVALLQIDDGTQCFLLRVLKIRSTLRDGLSMPPALEQLLGHSRIVFTGSAIHGDVRMLRDQFGVDTANAVDLQVSLCFR